MSDDVREELTAYLDGELDAASSERVEERLRSDPASRRELARLEQAWDMLEHLDRAAVSNDFTRSTLEMAAHVAEADLRRPAASPRAWKGAAAALLVAVGLAGYLGGTWLWPDPNQKLLRELPVLENIDLYDQGDSIDFLRKLERSGLFDEEADHAG